MHLQPVVTSGLPPPPPQFIENIWHRRQCKKLWFKSPCSYVNCSLAFYSTAAHLLYMLLNPDNPPTNVTNIWTLRSFWDGEIFTLYSIIHSSSTIHCLKQRCFSGGFLELEPTIILCREKLSFRKSWLVCPLMSVKEIQRYTEITHDPLLKKIFWLSTERLPRSTLHLKDEGEGSLYSCTL